MDFEKLGAFYLGKEYDLQAGRRLDRLVMYDARDLTTHAVCLGMTGSGKTGLCISLLEEAAIDGVPALVIDPKGDITNFLLQFPEMRAEDFLPWINAEDARRKGVSVEEYAAGQAELWRRGLAEWGQDASRVAMLKRAVDARIYTPGSDAGIPVSLLRSFDPPALDAARSADIIRERIDETVGALLGLLGLAADPIQSREHILLASLFQHFWKEGQSLDLARLIQAIQNPPVRQLGVLDVDTFYPPSDRFQLAMKLNAIVASPSFAGWMKGEPLEIGRFLADDSGRPRHSIFYIAHLAEAERNFFVAMLLNRLLGWMYSQPGTTSLRALLYMDEIFGFFPPVANPPTKKPMLTLLKQARAFGIGTVLATQNPVDLDYKGLTNAGTWFIGRLQAERDKARVLDGLIGASNSAGKGGLDRRELENIISGLKSRVFLLHNVHAAGPLIFQTRWAMSYLRGPLTREQIARLREAEAPAREEQAGAALSGVQFGGSEGQEKAVGILGSVPVVPPGVAQVFLHVGKSAASARLEVATDVPGFSADETDLLYRPRVLGTASVRFFDRQSGVDQVEEVALLLAGGDGPSGLRWDDAFPLEVETLHGVEQPESGAHFEVVPASFNEARELRRLAGDLVTYLHRNRELEISYSPVLKAYSQPGESVRDFRMRLSQEAREVRDREVDDLTVRYGKKIDTLESRLRTAELALEHEREKEQGRGTEFLVSVGETVLGMFMGRRSSRAASSSMSRYRMKKTARMSREKAEEKVEDLRAELQALEKELKAATEEISRRWEAHLEQLDTRTVKPRKTDIQVGSVRIAWEPIWVVRESAGGRTREVTAR